MSRGERRTATDNATNIISNINGFGNEHGLTIATVEPKSLATKHHTYTSGRWTTEAYLGSYLCRFKSIQIPSLARLEEVLQWLEPRPRRYIVRGASLIPPNIWARRLACSDGPTLPTLEAAPSRVFCVDYDDDTTRPNLADGAYHAEAALKSIGLEGVGCVWQWSASAGIKPGLRLHLWLLADGDLSDEELRAWAKRLKASGVPVDPSLYNPAQPHYTAAPTFIGGSDPIPVRMGILHGPPAKRAVVASAWFRERLAARFRSNMARDRTQRLRQNAQPQGNRGEGAMRWLDTQCEELEATPQGERHSAVRRIAYSAGGAVEAGLLDHSYALERLMLAVESFNKPRRHEATIRSGLKQGAAQPWPEGR